MVTDRALIRVVVGRPVAQVLTATPAIPAQEGMGPRLAVRALPVVRGLMVIRAPLVLPVLVPPMVAQALRAMPGLTVMQVLQVTLVQALLLVALGPPETLAWLVTAAQQVRQVRARLRVAQALPEALAQRVITALVRQMVTQVMLAVLATLRPSELISQCPAAQAATAEMLEREAMAWLVQRATPEEQETPETPELTVQVVLVVMLVQRVAPVE